MQCEHMESPVNGRDLYYYFPDGTEAGFLCDTCAANEGFCPVCGYFVLGSDDDRTLSQYGCCAECFDEIVSDTQYSDPDFDY